MVLVVGLMVDVAMIEVEDVTSVCVDCVVSVVLSLVPANGVDCSTVEVEVFELVEL